MALVSMKELLEAGVHFGHLTRRWHPKMKKYIYHDRNGIYIIDLHQTLRQLEDACAFVRGQVAEGGSVLFVGTKRQAQDAIREHATRCAMPYVTVRWLGGLLTNFRTIRSRVDHLERLIRDEESGEWERLPKKEQLALRHKQEKLLSYLGGIRNLHALPKVIFVVDVRREIIACHEGRRLGIPIVGVVDTNCDPGLVDLVIPGNDDAIRAIRLITEKIADSVVAGKGDYQQGLLEKQEAEAPAAEGAEAAGGEEEILSPEDMFIEVEMDDLYGPEEA